MFRERELGLGGVVDKVDMSAVKLGEPLPGEEVTEPFVVVRAFPGERLSCRSAVSESVLGMSIGSDIAVNTCHQGECDG